MSKKKTQHCKRTIAIALLSALWTIGLYVILISSTAEAASLSQSDASGITNLTFYVANDIRDGVGGPDLDTAHHFRGVVEAIRDLDGGGAMLISPGDLTPLTATYHTITRTLGSDYPWYPGVGNHEYPGGDDEPYPGANLDWLRAFDYDVSGPDIAPNIVRTGPTGCPKTTYSFDYGAAHFVMLNVYCDADGEMAFHGDIRDHLYDWLSADLDATTQPLIFVFGHEPAYPQRDDENGRIRHAHNSLNQFVDHRDRFWKLLNQHNVAAYFSGHTHAYSAVRIDGVWHISTGHAAGIGVTEMRSTFLRVIVDGTTVQYQAYRQRPDDLATYELTDVWDNATTTRDVVPTPVVTPTAPPHGLLPRADLPRVTAGLGLALITLALVLGTLLAIIIAFRANAARANAARTKRQEDEQQPSDTYS